MIDFGKDAVFKLKPVDMNSGVTMVQPLLIDGESVIMTFQAIRDMVVFTNKRIITINVQGISGKKKDSSQEFWDWSELEEMGVI